MVYYEQALYCFRLMRPFLGAAQDAKIQAMVQQVASGGAKVKGQAAEALSSLAWQHGSN
jgi:hypothetical protein